jgi:hypothetical protein
VLPYAIFSNPSESIRRIIEDGPRFARALLIVAQQDQQLSSDGIDPVRRTMALPRNFGRLGVAIEFEEPRAPGEAYFAAAILSNGNDAPQYFVGERSIDESAERMGRSAMFCGWHCSPAGETQRHYNMGPMPIVELADFLIRVGEALS